MLYKHTYYFLYPYIYREQARRAALSGLFRGVTWGFQQFWGFFNAENKLFTESHILIKIHKKASNYLPANGSTILISSNKLRISHAPLSLQLVCTQNVYQISKSLKYTQKEVTHT